MSGAYRGAPVKTARLLLFVAVIAALAGGGQAKEDTRSSEGGNLNCDGLIVTCPPDARLDCPLHILPEYTGWPAVMGEYPPFDTAFVDVGRKCGCSMTFVRVWRVIDAVGHCDTCMQIIAAEDNVPPIIECPPDVVFECDDIGDFGRATATDNCDPNPTISYKDTITFELCPWEFSGIRTWIARDRCGNMSTCEQKITIQDSKPPVIICCPHDTVVGPDVNIECLGHAIARDNCNPRPKMSYEAARLPGGSPCDYSILRSWEFSDCCCNIVACQQRVTVRCVADLYTRAREEDMGDDESPDQRKLEPGSLSLPGEIELASHPNPLSASTTISYALPADGDALVEIFDIQGRKIATVASGHQQAGYHGVVWNGNDSQNSPVVSGIYFCRLQFEDRPSILEKLVKF